MILTGSLFQSFKPGGCRVVLHSQLYKKKEYLDLRLAETEVDCRQVYRWFLNSPDIDIITFEEKYDIQKALLRSDNKQPFVVWKDKTPILYAELVKMGEDVRIELDMDSVYNRYKKIHEEALKVCLQYFFRYDIEEIFTDAYHLGPRFNPLLKKVGFRKFPDNKKKDPPRVYSIDREQFENLG